MNILVTGANGQLGNEMRRVSLDSRNRYLFTDVNELDITDATAVRNMLKKEQIDVIVNCAAYTNVDRAEDDFAMADLLNNKAVENLAVAAAETGATLIDQVGTPTYAGDLAALIYNIIEENLLDRQGVYHFSNEGVCSWYDFAKEICELSGNNCDIQPCHSDEFPSKVERPHFSVLDKTKVKETFGITIPYWKDSLKKCMLELETQQ